MSVDKTATGNSELLSQLHEYERKVLPALRKTTDPAELEKVTGLDGVQLSRAFQWLSNKDLLTLAYEKKQLILLGENGKLCAEKKLPELRILSAITDGNSHNAADLEKNADVSQQEIGASIGVLKKLRAIDITKGDAGLSFTLNTAGKAILQSKSATSYDAQDFLEGSFPVLVDELTASQKELVEDLRKRKDMLVLETKQTPKVALTKLGEEIAGMDLEAVAESTISQLTSDMLKDESYKNKTFRPYDPNSRVPSIHGGRLHPMTAVIRLVKQIFVEMGFAEMKGPWVETAFWCMDAMWIPQDHPARDVQDTFYLGKSGSLPDDKKLLDDVKAVHETGGDTGSKGYNYKWDPKKAADLILRTHTTATTYRVFGQKNLKTPMKRFYVGKVFRNEAIDATHLPEFYQVEGFIMGDGLTLEHLLGVIKEFYAKLGFDKIKFKMTYNPYTEPSVEAFYYDEKRQKWMELINSGMFRPESLSPYGIDKPVIAWGLGLERLAMLMLEQDKLKDIIGPTSDLRWLREYKVPKR